MAITIYKGNMYKSRSALVRFLLLKKTMRKSHIARISKVTPQTVEGIYQSLISQKKLDDYYTAFKENLKKERLINVDKQRKNREESVPLE